MRQGVFLLFFFGIVLTLGGLILGQVPYKYSEKDILSSENSSKPQNKKTLFKVVKVIDGDTIDVALENGTKRIRLIGVDTPETVDPGKPKQCFGEKASSEAKEMLGGKYVFLEKDQTQENKDKHGRLLRYVILEDERNFNLVMIQKGFAREYTHEGREYKYQKMFKEAENNAKWKNLGLWAECYNDK